MDNKKETRGGKRDGAGRKPKADEDKVKQLHYSAMVKEFKSEEAFLRHGYKQAKESYAYYKLMHERYYGKPKETKELKHDFEQQPTFEELKIVVNNTTADE